MTSLYGRYLQWMYRGGRPSRFVQFQNQLSAMAFGAGILPDRAAALEIRGRRSGRTIAFPIVITNFEAQRFLVSMLGNNTNWVRNLKAAHGQAVLRHGQRETVHLEAVDPSLRAPILKRFLEVAPGARPHIPVDRSAPIQDFEQIAADYPVFRIDPRTPSPL